MLVFGLMLIEQFFCVVLDDLIWNIKLLCLGFVGQFVFDIYFFLDVLMFNWIDGDVISVCGFVYVMIIFLLLFVILCSCDWILKIYFLQKVVFYLVILLIVGFYLLLMVSVGYYVCYFGGDWGCVM